MGDEHIKFEDNHIEVDSHLSWFLGKLVRKYGNNAFYIHLKRIPEVLAKSFVKNLVPVSLAYFIQN